MGDLDTNWSAVGYAANKILSTLPPSAINVEQAAILQEFEQWKAQPMVARWTSYDTIKLAAYDSTRRPAGRATSLGVLAEMGSAPVETQVPKTWNGSIGRASDESTIRMHDHTWGEPKPTAINRKIVSFARRYLDAANTDEP